MINNLGTPSSKLQINFGVLQTDTENSATGVRSVLRHKSMAFNKGLSPFTIIAG